MGFDENLKRLRLEKGLSQEQLAEKLNISRQAISKWESAKAYPDIDNLKMLREVFNISLDELILEGKTDNKDSQEHLMASDIDISKKENLEDKKKYKIIDLMLPGFIIGIGIGIITGNFLWAAAGAFVGEGISNILENIKDKK